MITPAEILVKNASDNVLELVLSGQWNLGQNVAAEVAGGFKLFFQKDKPSLLTPKQVLGMGDVGNTRVKEPPRYINYQ